MRSPRAGFRKIERRKYGCSYDVGSRNRAVSMGTNTNASSGTVDPTIEFRAVTYSFDSRCDNATVKNVSFSVNAGQTLVLLGRSGSGKTTLLRLINRLLLPASGDVIVFGRKTSEWDPITLRRRIGYVIQEGGLFPHLTVSENIGLVPTLEKWEPSRIAVRVHELLTLVGLDPAEYSQRRPHQLSGGQRQRVGVARALAADPPVLLMDEPFGALDPVTRAELQREFHSLASRLNKTIVFVTHDLREAMFLASQILLLQKGQIVASSAPEDFQSVDHPEVRAFTNSLSLAGSSA